MAKTALDDCTCVHADKKHCTNPECSQQKPQPIDCFHKNKNSPDGYMNHCKSCRKKYHIQYRTTQAYKSSQKAYKQSDLGKISNRIRGKRYRTNEKGGRRSKEYWHKYKNNPENICKIKARAIISSAVRSGKLPHASSLICTFCSSEAKNYHHHSYAEQYHLSVIPVCLLCHARLHENN